MNDKIKTQKPPFWIKEINIENLFLKYNAENSYTHQILNDDQLGYFDNDVVNYIHLSRNLADIDDVEFYSNLNITFNPSFEEIVLHQFRVFRDGKWIDKLSDVKIKIIQREEELDKLIYNENQTLSLIFYDIRTGDLFDYSYSRKGKNPVIKDFFGKFEYINSKADEYLSHMYVAIDKKNSENLEIRYFNQEEKLKEELHDTYVSYELTTENLKGLKIPDDAPKWYDPWSRILFCNTSTWKEVNNWARDIYNKDIYLADEEILKLIDECRHHSDNKGQQIAYALFYVQEQIRYFADGSNLGGMIPIDPNKSLQMRFADCKNKVVVLKTILNGLGVESYPVLVSTKNGEMLSQEGPNITAFNHMIIQVVYEDKKYWFDATFTGQAGGIEHISQANYGYALVLNENENELQSMKPAKVKGEIRVKQLYDLRDENATLEVTTTYTDFEADRMRKRVNGRKIHELQENNIQFYEKRFPNVELRQAHKVTDDKYLNKISIKEHYTLGNAWEYNSDEELFEVTFECDEIRYAYEVPQKNKRTAPFHMIYPSKIIEEREIFFPYKYDEKINTKKEDNSFFYYEKEEQLDKTNNKLLQTYTFYAKVSIIDAKDISEYIKKTDNIYVSYSSWHDDPYDKSGLKATQALSYEEQRVYIHAKQFYDLREKEVTLTIKTDYFDHEAYKMHMKTKHGDLEKLQEQFLDYYKKIYQDVKLLKPYMIDDNVEEKKFSIIEEYSLGEAWRYDKEEKDYRIVLYNDMISQAFDLPTDENMDKPFELKYPSYVVEEREIAFAYEYEVFTRNRTLENDFFNYYKEAYIDKKNNKLFQKYTYQAKVKEIMPNVLNKYIKKSEKIEEVYAVLEFSDPYSSKKGTPTIVWVFMIIVFIGLKYIFSD